MDIEEIIVNLKLLEKLDKNQKLITRGSYLNIESRSLVPEFIRRWNRQDSRHETIRKITSVVNFAIGYIQNGSNPEHVFNIKEYLEKSKVGISNLKETYATCNQTCARLDVILDKIDKHLELS